MAKEKYKTLEEMQKEEWGNNVKPSWEVHYKDFTFIAYKNSLLSDIPILSCYIYKGNTLLEHSGRTQYFTQEKALEELKWKYEKYLEVDVISILKENAIKRELNVEQPIISIELLKNNVSDNEWEKVKEYFNL